MNPIQTLKIYAVKTFKILSSHPLLGLPSDILPSSFPNKILYSLVFEMWTQLIGKFSRLITWEIMWEGVDR